MIAGSCRTLVCKGLASQSRRFCTQAVQRGHQGHLDTRRAIPGTVGARRQVQASSAADAAASSATSAAASTGIQVQCTCSTVAGSPDPAWQSRVCQTGASCIGSSACFLGMPSPPTASPPASAPLMPRVTRSRRAWRAHLQQQRQQGSPRWQSSPHWAVPTAKKQRRRCRCCAGGCPQGPANNRCKAVCGLPGTPLSRAQRSGLAWPFACTQPAAAHAPCHLIGHLPACLQAAGIPYSEYELSEQLEVSQTHAASCHRCGHPALCKFTLPVCVAQGGWLRSASTIAAAFNLTCLHPLPHCTCLPAGAQSNKGCHGAEHRAPDFCWRQAAGRRLRPAAPAGERRPAAAAGGDAGATPACRAAGGCAPGGSCRWQAGGRCQQADGWMPACWLPPAGQHLLVMLLFVQLPCCMCTLQAAAGEAEEGERAQLRQLAADLKAGVQASSSTGFTLQRAAQWLQQSSGRADEAAAAAVLGQLQAAQLLAVAAEGGSAASTEQPAITQQLVQARPQLLVRLVADAPQPRKWSEPLNGQFAWFGSARPAAEVGAWVGGQGGCDCGHTLRTCRARMLHKLVAAVLCMQHTPLLTCCACYAVHAVLCCAGGGVPAPGHPAPLRQAPAGRGEESGLPRHAGRPRLGRLCCRHRRAAKGGGGVGWGGCSRGGGLWAEAGQRLGLGGGAAAGICLLCGSVPCFGRQQGEATLPAPSAHAQCPVHGVPRCPVCLPLQVDLSGLGSREQRMAFFINTYNALVVHALVVFGAADGTLSRRVVAVVCGRGGWGLLIRAALLLGGLPS